MLFLGGLLDLDKYIFSWQVCFVGGHLRLQLSCMQVNTVVITVNSYVKICTRLNPQTSGLLQYAPFISNFINNII